MTDFSEFPIQLPQERLPDSCQMGLKPPAPRSRSYRTSLAPMNATVFAPSGSLVFEIPVGRRGTILDTSHTYLKFGIQASSTAGSVQGLATGAFIENTAYSFFQTMTVSCAGAVLETINKYGQLCNFLLDNSLSKSQKGGMSSLILSNPYNVLSVTAVNATLGSGAGTSTGGYCVTTAGDRSGLGIATGTAIASDPVYNACLPIMSGIIGVNSEKCLPISEIRSPLRVEFLLSATDDAIVAFLTAAGLNWQLVNVELELTYIEIASDAPLFQPDAPILISSSSYRQTSTSLTSTQTGEVTVLLPFRYYSLNSIYARFRNYPTQANGAVTAAYRKSSSVNPGIGSYYFRIGEGFYPTKPVQLINGYLTNSGAEAQAELQKSFHSLSSLTAEPAYGAQNYNVCSTAQANGQWALAYANTTGRSVTAIDTHGNAFAIGQEFETFSNRSPQIMSGISTQRCESYFTFIFGSSSAGVALTPVQATTVDIFCNYSMILVIENGTIRVIT